MLFVVFIVVGPGLVIVGGVVVSVVAGPILGFPAIVVPGLVIVGVVVVVIVVAGPVLGFLTIVVPDLVIVAVAVRATQPSFPPFQHKHPACPHPPITSFIRSGTCTIFILFLSGPLYWLFIGPVRSATPTSPSSRTLLIYHFIRPVRYTTILAQPDPIYHCY